MIDQTAVLKKSSTWTRRAVRQLRVAQALLLLSLAMPLLGANHLTVPASAHLQMPLPLFEFNSSDEADWEVVNDGVMGGRSAGFVTVEDGNLTFTGTLVTRGGGFTSVRAPRAVDLTGEQGLELRVRGSGRQFEVEVDDGTRVYGRNVSRRAAFPTTQEWTVLRVPFSALRSTFRGEPVNTPAVDPARIQRLGLYIADGQDGPFRLQVDYIRSYGADDE